MAKENLTIERNTDKKPKDEKIESLLQKGKNLNITEDTRQKEISTAIKDEFEAIKEERMDIDGCDYDSFLDAMDRQRKGKMPKTAGRAYNLDTGFTKIKCGDIVMTTMDAIYGVSPLFSITPRPGLAKSLGVTVCQNQQEYLDYVLDEIIPLKSPLRVAADSATYKRVGVIKWIHKVRKEKRIRTETYTGKNEVVGQNQQTGEPITENKALKEIELLYATDIQKDPKKFEWIFKAAIEEKKFSFDVEYDDIVYNDPFPKFVDNKNFYVRKATEGYIGLCETELTVERITMTYYELKQLEKENKFINVDKLTYDTPEEEKKGEQRKGYATENYDMLECVYMLEEGGELIKTVIWLSEDKMCYMGGIYFPFTVIGSYYVPHYMTTSGTGFYQTGVAEELTDTHLSKNAILNHTLEAAQMANTLTPITKKNSQTADQFLENKWTNGFPLYSDGPLDFVNNHMKAPDIGGLLALNNELSRIGGEISRVSDLRSGRETPLDPNAPGNKTAMLLQESGRGVKDYVDTFSQGFNLDGLIILRIYYEMSGDEREYMNQREAQVTGSEPKRITRAALMARTLIQSQVMAYDFDKMNAKRQDLLNNQFLTNESLIMNNAQANYERVNILISSMDPKWRNSKNKLLPSLEEFNQQQAVIAFKAVQQFIAQTVQEAQITQKPPVFDPQALIQLVTQLQSMAAMPRNVLEEKQKQIAEEEKQGAK